MLGTDRVAVIAALNIAHQLRELEAEHQQMKRDLDKMHSAIDEALEQNLQLEL